MMKAFSFLTILESLSKKLSILRTKMHSDDLRVNHGTITRLLRVNPLLSHCASRRVSHFAAILTILFTVGVGNVWGAVTIALPTPIEDGDNLKYTYTTSDEIKVKNVGPVCFEIPSANLSGEINIKGSGANNSRYLYIYKNNGTEKDTERKIVFQQAYAPFTFSQSDILTQDGKYYLVFGTTDDYKMKGECAQLVVAKSAIGGGGGETPTTYTVTFDSNGGSDVNSITQSSAGAEITLPAAPTKSGYAFNGWYTAATGGTKAGAAGASYTPTGNITLHAQWISLIATKTYGNITFLDVASIEANSQDSGGKQYLTYGSYYIAKTLNITTWYNCSDENPGSNLETSGKTISNPSNFGFFTVSETPGDVNYGGVKVHASRERFYYVTGATSVAAIVADNGESKYVQVEIQTVNQNGQLGEVNTKGSYNSNNAYLLDGGDLDPTKYYKITFTSNAGSNCYLYQIRFGKTQASYSVTYDDNDATSGSVPTDNEDYENGATVTVKSNTGSLAKIGYTFGGWNTKDDGTGTNYTAGTGTFTISANTTLYAKWNAETYTITYSGLEGATHSNPATYTIESETITFTAPSERTGYTFAGWDPTSIEQGSTGNKTVTATWTANQYDITYKDQGNADFSGSHGANYPTKHTYGKATTLVEPTKANYEFGGWYTNSECTGSAVTSLAATAYTAKITLYAKWTAKTCNITFDKENGTGGTTQVTATYNSSTIASITNPTRECYTFEGWYSGENGTGSLVINTTGVLQANVSGYTGTNGVWIATENKTLYAKWTKNATTLLLQRTGSEATPAGGVAVGGDAGTLNCIAEQGTIASYQWKQNTRGSKDGAVNAVGEGATTANFSPKPTAAGSYWYYCVATDECGNEVETTLSGCFLFKALYTVTFNPNNGSVDPTSATQSSYNASITLPTPTWDGHTFAGWYTATSGGTKIGDAGASYTPIADITIYAQWETPCVAPTNAVINGGGTYNSGSNITLTVTANNITNGTTTYTWYRSNSGQEAAITAGPIQVASTNNTYVINSCVQSDAQVYYCLISNGNGCNVVASTSIAINVVTTYTLTYDANAGTDEVANMPAPEQHTPGTYTLSDLVPTRIGYTFAGWNRNPEGTGDNFNAAAQFTTGALNETLYAKWTPETYYINYYEAVGEVNDISGLNQITINDAPTSYTILDAVELPALPAKDGYTATGWYSQWCVFENQENTQYWAGCTPTNGHLAGYYGHANYIVKYTLNTPVTPEPEPEGDCWNISDDAFVSLLGSITANQTVNGLNIVATSEKNVQVEAMIEQQVFDGYTFTHRFKLNGTGANNSRHLKFAVTGACTIDVYLVSGSSEVQRTLNVAIGSFGTNVTELVAGTTIAKQTYEYTGGATDIYMYSKNSGINIYQICVTYPATPTPEPGTETCITLGENDSQDIKSDGTATVGNYTITASGINWQSTSAKIDNDNDYIIITNSTGITAANVTAKSNILYVTYSSSIDGTESKTTEEVTATNDFTELTLDVPNGTKYIKLQRENGGSSIYVSEICLTEGSPLPSCTTPVLSNLDNKKVCPGSDVTWTASNTAELADGETTTYQWTKNSTVLSNDATLTLENVTEAAGGTYVVTATVSAEGKASKTASKEVTLTVTPATATPTITANANTIFAGNDVTLTASCVSSGVSYKWYTCTDAEGNGESAIGAATNATYTLTAGAAGTYYYKVIVEGDGTRSCGTAEKVYELVVKTPSAGCYDMIIFDSSKDQTIPAENATGTEANTGASWANVGTSKSSGSCTYTYNGKTYNKGWKFVGGTTKADSRYIQFEIPSGYVGSLFMAGYITSTDRSVFISDNPTGSLVTKYAYIKPNITNELNTASADLDAGTYYVCATDAFLLTELSIEICSDVNCTDPQVTATVDNATVCEGTENVTFTATNYADGTTFFQWQKKNGNTWEDISGATSDTYTIPSVATAHAGQYRVIAKKECNRISEEVKLTVLTAPTFNTFATTASVMKGNALAISDVQATGATGYAWYKSTDNSFDAAVDTKVGTSKDLLLAAASIPEAADQIFYLFCVASNSCGTTESQAITVTVTPFVEEECATKGNEGDREFVFANTGCSSITYKSKSAWETNSSKEYLTYTAPTGRYFATAKVTVAHTNNSKAVYGYSTDGGTTWTYKETSSAVPAAYTTITIDDLADADVNAFRIGRNMDGKGAGTGKFYLAEACFTYENACTETTLIVGPYYNEYNISTQMDFVEPTFTLKSGETTLEGQTLTYTSSNTAIATVDEDGNVTFEGMTGTVTITATFAGGEINETEYCACQATYTITV